MSARLQQLFVRPCPQNVGSNLCDRGSIERTQLDVLGTGFDQLILGVLNWLKSLIGAKRHDPCNRKSREALWQLTHRDRTTCGCPVQIIEADQYRIFQVPLLRLTTRGPESTSRETPVMRENRQATDDSPRESHLQRAREKARQAA